jgi:hypothetical protein
MSGAPFDWCSYVQAEMKTADVETASFSTFVLSLGHTSADQESAEVAREQGAGQQCSAARFADECDVRVDLAACYRPVAMFGWDDLVFTHLTARAGPSTSLPYQPLRLEEVTASSLVKIDLSGQKVTTCPYEINPAGYTIHSAIHAAREDARCVLHVHTDAGVAVPAQREGLLPISQNACSRSPPSRTSTTRVWRCAIRRRRG